MRYVRDFFTLPESNNDHHPAIRIALGVGIPLLLLVAVGRMDLAIFATLGAFTGVYGRGEPHLARFTQQWRAGVLMLVAITAGLTASEFGVPTGLLVLGAAVIGALGFVATRITRLAPVGSLFFVFAFSATAFMKPAAAFLPAIAIAAGSVALSLLLGVAGRMLPGHRTPWVRHRAPALTTMERHEVYAEAWMHVASILIAGTIAVLVGFGHSYWAMIAATVPVVGSTAAHGVDRGVHRIVGTASGLVIAGFLLGLRLEGLALALTVLVLQFLIELFITRHYALAQTFVTPLALLMTEAAHPANPWLLMRDRAVETVIGAGVGISVVLLASRLRGDRD